MDVILVRHGESEGNASRRMQGRLDAPLTERGQAQAARLGGWLAQQGVGWHAAYTSPLLRAARTAEIVAETTGQPAAIPDADLREIDAGSLAGFTREEIDERYPDFMRQPLTTLGDFEQYGGESYDAVQERVRRVTERLVDRHRTAEDTVLVVAHGGFNFQFLKSLICIPVPRVCIVRWGNCTATLVRCRERRGQYMAEVGWHVPVELMGGSASEGSSGVFR